MLMELGVIGLSYSVFELSHPIVKTAYNKHVWKSKLRMAFEKGKLYYKKDKKDKVKIMPKILNTDLKEDKNTFVFSVPKGLNPEEFTNKFYVFQQCLSKHIELDIDINRVIIKVYPKGLPTKFTYKYDEVKESINKYKLPIVCGMNLEGIIKIFDLVTNPHVLIAGETGSGKSSEIRSILTTLIKTKSPDELRLILGDLKRSEFFLFKKIEHVEGVYHSADELRPQLNKVKKEMIKRGNMLDRAEVNNIGELNEKLPYIIVCIDEFVLLKKETDILEIIEQITSIGRSLGIFCILSCQRPDSKLMEGGLKVNLTVRMGLSTADSINSKIIGTPGAEKLDTPGRMILKINSHIQEVQCPWLENKKAKKLLEPYKVKTDNMSTLELQDETQSDEYDKVKELLQ